LSAIGSPLTSANGRTYLVFLTTVSTIISKTDNTVLSYKSSFTVLMLINVF
jgi:hypothetical protein